MQPQGVEFGKMFAVAKMLGPALVVCGLFFFTVNYHQIFDHDHHRGHKNDDDDDDDDDGDGDGE